MSTVIQRGDWSYPEDTADRTVEQEVTNRSDEKRYARTQLQIIWFKFLHNRAAMAGGF